MSELHVIFGTGLLSRWTAEALMKMGKSVRMVNRSGKVNNPPGSVEIVASDAYDVAKNIQITKDAAAIYQCASRTIMSGRKNFHTCKRPFSKPPALTVQN